MRLTPYNLHEAIEMLRGRALQLLLSEEVVSLEGKHAAALFELVGDMSPEAAQEAINAFAATQEE